MPTLLLWVLEVSNGCSSVAPAAQTLHAARRQLAQVICPPLVARVSVGCPLVMQKRSWQGECRDGLLSMLIGESMFQQPREMQYQISYLQCESFLHTYDLLAYGRALD